MGATGAGKTTLVDIILGLLRPQAGRMLVDGVPINSDNLRSWRRTIGYVPQHIYLTDGSIRENIAFGIPAGQVDDARIREAAAIARLDQFVEQELPNGYDTVIGERGIRLSGGQRQRIGIARALYHDPQVLIMDEATSALDNRTEHAVMEAINALGRNKTVILIAHRLSTVERCDRIYLLEQGRVQGVGDFEELIESNEHFRAIAQVELRACIACHERLRLFLQSRRISR